MSEVVDMQEEYLKELRKFPKIARAEVWGDCLIIETNKIHLYTDERDFRTELGRFVVLFHHTEIVVKNQDGIGWKNDLHHPHVDGNYVSLAAHGDPLNKAIAQQDWVTCGNIIIKFLEDYKFGDKAKQFFEKNGMERRNPETKQWETVTEKDMKEIFKKDARFRSTYSYSGGSHRVGRWNEEDKKKRELIEKYFPVGTRIRLNWYNGMHQKVEPGSFGTVAKPNYPNQLVLSVDWEPDSKGHKQGLHYKPSVTSDDFDAVNPDTGEVTARSVDVKEELEKHMTEWDDAYDAMSVDPIKETGGSRSATSFPREARLGLTAGVEITDEDRLQDAKDDVFKKVLNEHFPIGCRVQFVRSNAENVMAVFQEDDLGTVTNVGFKNLYVRWDNNRKFTPMMAYDKINRVDPKSGVVLSTFDEALAEAEERWEQVETVTKQEIEAEKDGEGGQTFAEALHDTIAYGDYDGCW